MITYFFSTGKAKGDIPGVRFKVVKVSGVGLMALWRGLRESVYFNLGGDLTQ